MILAIVFISFPFFYLMTNNTVWEVRKPNRSERRKKDMAE